MKSYITLLSYRIFFCCGVSMSTTNIESSPVTFKSRRQDGNSLRPNESLSVHQGASGDTGDVILPGANSHIIRLASCSDAQTVTTEI